jgi:hypothetical protein
MRKSKSWHLVVGLVGLALLAWPVWSGPLQLAPLGRAAAQDTVAETGASSPKPVVEPLGFPAPRGEVIFEHNWSQGDIPLAYAEPGAGASAPRFAAKNKFRIVNPAGRLIVVTDPASGQEVLDILVTREDDARFAHHHTQIEVHIPKHWAKGRFLIPGERYLLEVWRRNIDYKPDERWEVWSQNHSMYDSKLEAARNPSIAIDGGGGGINTLTIRSDSNPISFKDDRGKWSYSRQDTYSIGANTSDVWELWQMEVVYDDQAGALHLWRNGELVHSEEGKPVGYNDQLGPPWQLGWYKYFSSVPTAERHTLIGPLRVQLLTSP